MGAKLDSEGPVKLDPEMKKLFAIVLLDELCSKNLILPEHTVIKWYNTYSKEDEALWVDEKSLMWNILNCMQHKGLVTDTQFIQISAVVDREEAIISNNYDEDN